MPRSCMAAELALVAIRIATWEQKIQEIEIIVSPGQWRRPMGDAGKQIEATGQPRAPAQPQHPGKGPDEPRGTDPRRHSYFANLQGSTGKTHGAVRADLPALENGFQTNLVKPTAPPPTANVGGAPSTAAPARPGMPNILAMSCEDQQRSGFFPFVTSIRDRRFPVVDREKGIVMAFGFFDHTGTVTPTSRTPQQLHDVREFPDRARQKPVEGKIDQVEAVMANAPYKMRNEVWREGDRRANAIGVPTGK